LVGTNLGQPAGSWRSNPWRTKKIRQGSLRHVGKNGSWRIFSQNEKFFAKVRKWGLGVHTPGVQKNYAKGLYATMVKMGLTYFFSKRKFLRQGKILPGGSPFPSKMILYETP
jgi:hypothetical protein